MRLRLVKIRPFRPPLQSGARKRRMLEPNGRLSRAPQPRRASVHARSPLTRYDARRSHDQPPSPPTAEQRPYSYERHGVKIEDPWHWLRDPKYPEVDDPDVLAYLHAENAYFEGWAGQHKELLDTLFEEMKARIKEDDSSVPLRDGDYLYWWAFKPGAQYRTWYRKPVGGGEDEIIFDEPAEAHGEHYFRLGALEASPDGKLARDSGRLRWIGAVSAAHPRSRHGQGHGDGHRGRHRPAGVDQR